MNLFVLLILLTTITAAHTEETMTKIFRWVFYSITHPVETVMKIFRWIFGISHPDSLLAPPNPSMQPELSPGSINQAESPGSIKQAKSPGSINQAKSPGSINQAKSPLPIKQAKSPGSIKQAKSPMPIKQAESPLPITQAERSGPSINFEQPNLRKGWSEKKHYADLTFLGSNRVLVTIVLPKDDLKQRKIFFPSQKSTISVGTLIKERTMNISEVIVDDNTNIAIFKFKTPRINYAFWFERLENENDMPGEGFIYADEEFYSCKIEKSQTPYMVKIIILNEPPEGTIKSGTRIIGKTRNDKDADTLIAMYGIIGENEKPPEFAILTTKIPKEKIYVDSSN